MSECIALPQHIQWRNPKFQLGAMYITPAAIVALTFSRIELIDVLVRHVSGDYGDLGQEAKDANEQALSDGRRILSVYRLADGTQLHVITEADRSSTTMMCADEN